MHTFETYIEIPITVHYDFQPRERQTRHCPGCPAAVVVNSVELFGKESDDLFSYIEANYMDSIEQECWDDLDGGGI